MCGLQFVSTSSKNSVPLSAGVQFDWYPVYFGLFCYCRERHGLYGSYFEQILDFQKRLQSCTKLLKHLANFHLFSQQSSVLQPPSPHFNVVNALVFLKQSLSNRKPQETTLSRGGGGRDILNPLASRDICEKCVKIVCFN